MGIECGVVNLREWYAIRDHGLAEMNAAGVNAAGVVKIVVG
jgi:hypothetical protein